MLYIIAKITTIVNQASSFKDICLTVQCPTNKGKDYSLSKSAKILGDGVVSVMVGFGVLVETVVVGTSV